MITINGNLSTSRSADNNYYRTHENKKKIVLRRSCNICHQSFTPEFKYQLFCGKCRTQDESFNFHEWMPQAPEIRLGAI